MAELHGKNGQEVLTEYLPKKRGRPKGTTKITITDTELKRIETLAGYGLTQEEICNVIGIGSTTLWQYTKQFPQFTEAWQRGKQKAKAYVAGKLMQKIEEGDLPAIKWYEQTRCGYSEKLKTENEHTHKVEPLESYLRRIKDVGSNVGGRGQEATSVIEATEVVGSDIDSSDSVS